MREIEIKVRLKPGEMDLLRQRLLDAQTRRGPVEDEINVLFEAADGHLRPAGETLRLRSFTGRLNATLTFKGPSDPNSRFKSREELEVRVEDGATARKILDALGYRATAQYQKRREHWTLFDIDVTLDRLSSGDYVEIEGSEDSIGLALARLGLAGRPHVREGYATLERQAPSAAL